MSSREIEANKPETALYRAPTFSLLLASHGGINSCGFAENAVNE